MPQEVPVIEYATPRNWRPLNISCWRWAVAFWALWIAGAAAVSLAFVAMVSNAGFAVFIGGAVAGLAGGFASGVFARRLLFMVESIHIAVCGIPMFLMVLLLVSVFAYDRPDRPRPSFEIAVVMPVAVHHVLGLIAVALRRRAQR